MLDVGPPRGQSPASPRDAGADVRLVAYALSSHPQKLVPAGRTRAWMDEFSDHHAYKCLPVAIGNAYGWQLVLPVDVTAVWNGGDRKADLEVTCSHPHQAISHFRNGVITFDVGYVFRTSPGFHLLVTGPSNVIKDGVAPMTAVIETDWLPYSFTFNYRFTRPGRVAWRAGEPYAQICVVAANLQNDIVPVVRNLADDPQLAADHAAWRARRADLGNEQAANVRKSWDKDYFVGRYADGRPTAAPHTMKLHLKDPIDERG